MRDSGRLVRGKDADSEAFFFFVDAGLILEVVEQATAGIEVHGVVELGGPGALSLKELAGSFVAHDETHHERYYVRRRSLWRWGHGAKVGVRSMFIGKA